MTKRLRWLWMLTFCAAQWPTVGRAQAPNEPTPEVRAHFDRAETHYTNENFALAAEEFQRVYDLLEGHPNRGVVLFNIARCQDRMGQFDLAIANYRQFLAEAPDSAPSRDRARIRIEELERRGATAVQDDDDEADPTAATTAPVAATEPSFVNWIIAGGLFALAVPAVAVPLWTVATEGECVAQDELGCIERVQFGAVDAIGLGLGLAAAIGAIVFAAGQPFQTQIAVSREGAYLGVMVRF